MRNSYDQAMGARDKEGLTDRKLKSSWDKGELYRIVFTMKNRNLSEKIKWEIDLI